MRRAEPMSTARGPVGRATAAGSAVRGPTREILDHAFLSRQTFGNPALEREVLVLFALQCEFLMSMLDLPDADIFYVAHTLTGAARGVGAARLAAIARETGIRAADRALDAAIIGELRTAALETAAYVRGLVRPADEPRDVAAAPVAPVRRLGMSRCTPTIAPADRERDARRGAAPSREVE